MRRFKLTCLFLSILGCAAAQPTVFSGGVVNGASFIAGQAVAPGSVVSIFGSGFAGTPVPADTVPLSNVLGQTAVFINGELAPLYFVADGQINVQLPWDILPAGQSTATANVVVQNGPGYSNQITFSVIPWAPGIFSIPIGVGNAVAINPDGSIAAPVGAIPGYPTHPAKVGDILLMYANGLGTVALNPDGTNVSLPTPGTASLDATRWATQTPQLLVGGVPAQVIFSGMSPQFPGINQINFYVPQVAAGAAIPVQLVDGNITTTDKVTIAIQ